MNIKGIKDYFAVWRKIMARPIYFYTFMEKGDWKDRSITFLLAGCWILAAALSLSVFVIQLVWILLGLVSGITGLKFLIILPVFAALCSMFLLIIFLMTGVLIFAVVFAALIFIALVNDRVFKLYCGKSDIKESIKSFFYSSCTLSFLILVILLTVFVKFKAMSFQNFMTGSNIIMFVSVLYAWGLWSIASRKIYKTGKMISVFLTLIPVLLMIILILAADYKLLPALERLIS
ncbi:MAG: hypothetical protein AABZ57_08500 [Candidatus Margulisiibacteriota bacterium]